MSINITVNGKFAKQYGSHLLLSDPQELKKTEEKERRKLRLLQVREECKKLAKKIRDEVNEEKKRELLKLQATKERELECWRQHALRCKGEEYCGAIFQIGTAHQAAKAENEAKSAKQKNRRSYKEFQKQGSTKPGGCPVNTKFNCQSSCPCNQPTNCAKQVKCNCHQPDENSINNNTDNSHKRKRNLSYTSSESECDDEICKEKTKLLQSENVSLSSSCDSTSISYNNNEDDKPPSFVPTNKKFLMKSPAVFLDVEVDTDDSVIISAPAEVRDKYAECNRQFDSVIRISPRKEQIPKENTCEVTSVQQSSTTTRQSSTTTSSVTVEKQNENILPLKNNHLKNTQVSKEKRFTIISDLVKNQQQVQPKAVKVHNFASHAPNSLVTSANITPQSSPRKQPREVSVGPPIVRSPTQSPRKTSAITKTVPTVKNKSAGKSSSINSGRVQFYDYNTKLTKEQDQAATAVSVQRQTNQDQPSAMEQADLENQRDKDRQLEALHKCQVMEERGQKALEREQIKRDCLELTEKLEALTREHINQFPSNDAQQHIFVDKKLRNEGKMNSAIEQLLQRPNVITCSEYNEPPEKLVNHKSPSNVDNLLNVASTNDKQPSVDDVSGDSCCSILLGYVDDQSKLIKQDLQKSDTNQNFTKQKRLQNLLDRLDRMRKALLEELRSERENELEKPETEQPKFSSKQENIRQVMDSITELRKQHAQILTNGKDLNPNLTGEKENELQNEEKILHSKVREFYKLQKGNIKPHEITIKKYFKRSRHEEGNEKDDTSSCNEKNKVRTNSSHDKENVIYSSGEKSLEIIITVRGEPKSITIPKKPKRKMCLKRSPSKLSTLIRSPQPSLPMNKKQMPKNKSQDTKTLGAKRMLQRQNSYDSNSTSYMSLPHELPTKIDDLAQCMTMDGFRKVEKPSKEPESAKQLISKRKEQQVSELSSESVNETRRIKPHPHVNPLIAQYVQRLLGMSRNAVHKLAESSSDIETPGSSIINTTDNVTDSDTIISEEHLTSLQYFIEENKSFIKDLEQSIRLQNNISLEDSMRILDDLWRKRLKMENLECLKSNKAQKAKDKARTGAKGATKNKIDRKSILKTKENETLTSNNGITTTAATNKSMERRVTSTGNLLNDANKTVSSADKRNSSSLKTCERSVETSDKGVDAKISIDSSKSEPDSQIARYAKLTENCTHRIAELTELINRVREEKQRLLEVTLSSVSDNGRQSTEYLELPEVKSKAQDKQDDLTRVSCSSDEIIKSKESGHSGTFPDLPTLSSTYKNKQIVKSRDSGIADSRPATALENRIDLEPLSQNSSESQSMPPPIRKLKPPPTLKRFSPQLPEDELPHELSTIFEVDTPATSRINTATVQAAEEKENPFNNVQQQPVKFPTFEQYIQQLDVNITQMPPGQTKKLQMEFVTLLEGLQSNRSTGEFPNYSEFPSINSYMRQLNEDDARFGETMEDSLAKLRISGIHPRNFPELREYIKQNASKSLPLDEQYLLDTESLENVSDGQTRSTTDNDTISLDIEEELMKRKILKKSFRVDQNILATESGVDKFSSSSNTLDLLDNELKIQAQQSPKELGKVSKEIKMFSSTTTSTNASALANSAIRAASTDENSRGSGRVLNLRDFLTRELEKLVNNSGSSTNSSSDEYFRNHFLHSLIGSLTPCTPGVTSKSGAQKTSTPVPMPSSQTHSTASRPSKLNSSNQLFSGESRLSSVRYEDRSVRFVASEEGNADQSSE